MEKMRCILKYMIAVLFMIIMMCCTGTSFTVYAAGEWTVDGDAKDYVYIPGGTYWAGSVTRTGALLYCVDKETKKIVPDTVTILYNNPKDENEDIWLDDVYIVGNTRVENGRVSFVNKLPVYCKELPDTGSFSNSNGSPLKSWLEADSGGTDGNGKNICNAAMLVLNYVEDVDAYNKVNHGKYSVCVEGMYGLAKYKRLEQENGELEDAAYCSSEAVVKNNNPGLTGEELKEKAVFKYFTTLRYFVQDCSGEFSYVNVGDRYGATGTANYKWIQSCARYFSISEEHYHMESRNCLYSP